MISSWTTSRCVQPSGQQELVRLIASMRLVMFAGLLTYGFTLIALMVILWALIVWDCWTTFTFSIQLGALSFVLSSALGWRESRRRTALRLIHRNGLWFTLIVQRCGEFAFAPDDLLLSEDKSIVLKSFLPLSRLSKEVKHLHSAKFIEQHEMKINNFSKTFRDLPLFMQSSLTRYSKLCSVIKLLSLAMESTELHRFPSYHRFENKSNLFEQFLRLYLFGNSGFENW